MSETQTPVRTPVRTDPGVGPDPDKFFNPDKLCPNQKKDAGDGARPL